MPRVSWEYNNADCCNTAQVLPTPLRLGLAVVGRGATSGRMDGAWARSSRETRRRTRDASCQLLASATMIVCSSACEDVVLNRGGKNGLATVSADHFAAFREVRRSFLGSARARASLRTVQAHTHGPSNPHSTSHIPRVYRFPGTSLFLDTFHMRQDSRLPRGASVRNN